MKWLSQSQVTSMQGLKEATLAPNDVTPLLSGPHRNYQPSKVKCHSSVGKAAREGQAYCTIANTVSPYPNPGNKVAACHSGLTDPRGELTLSHVTKAQSKHNFTTVSL